MDTKTKPLAMPVEVVFNPMAGHWYIRAADGTYPDLSDLAAAVNAWHDRIAPPAREAGPAERRHEARVRNRCPFCGGHHAQAWSMLRDGYADTPDDPDARGYWVRCPTCGCSGGWAKSLAGALWWWEGMRHAEGDPYDLSDWGGHPLAPCPACDETRARLYTLPRFGYAEDAPDLAARVYWVECGRCRCSGGWRARPEEAILAWASMAGRWNLKAGALEAVGGLIPWDGEPAEDAIRRARDAGRGGDDD